MEITKREFVVAPPPEEQPPFGGERVFGVDPIDVIRLDSSAKYSNGEPVGTPDCACCDKVIDAGELGLTFKNPDPGLSEFSGL